jgi:hypothetical protein
LGSPSLWTPRILRSTLVRYCFEHAIPLIPRGAGTGLAGEALGPGLIVDLSVHLRKILEITSTTATVEPGVGLEELNESLATHGRRFAPDPASGSSCTLGGMVATNASGGNAFRHGYTRDYIPVLGSSGTTGKRRPSSAPTFPILPRALKVRPSRLSDLLETLKVTVHGPTTFTPQRRLSCALNMS